MTKASVRGDKECELAGGERTGKSNFEPINWLLIKISAALSLSSLLMYVCMGHIETHIKCWLLRHTQQHGCCLWWTQLVVALLMIENYISVAETQCNGNDGGDDASDAYLLYK